MELQRLQLRLILQLRRLRLNLRRQLLLIELTLLLELLLLQGLLLLQVLVLLVRPSSFLEQLFLVLGQIFLPQSFFLLQV